MENKVIRLDRISTQQELEVVTDNWARRLSRLRFERWRQGTKWPQGDLLVLRLTYRLGRLDGLEWQINQGEEITVFRNRLTRLRY